MKFEIGGIYVGNQLNVVMQVTEISGPTVYFTVIEDLLPPTTLDLFRIRKGMAGTLNGFTDNEYWKPHRYYNTPLWKALNNIGN